MSRRRKAHGGDDKDEVDGRETWGGEKKKRWRRRWGGGE